MTISIDIDRPEVSETPEAYLHDEEVGAGDYVGVTSDVMNCVWHFDGHHAVRVGVPNPDHLSSVELNAGETLRHALQRVPMYDGKSFVIHKMKLPPGAYYKRLARPNDQHPLEAPGHNDGNRDNRDFMSSSVNQLRSLLHSLEQIFQVVHAHKQNFDVHGNEIRNLLLLASTECETHWRGILRANGVTVNNPTTNHFVKINSAAKLDEYVVELTNYPWVGPLAPFKGWQSSNPTQSLNWYDDYNAVKHDREANFARAKLLSAMNAVAACWITLVAQFGWYSLPHRNSLRNELGIRQVPHWRYSEIYTFGYDGFNQDAGPRDYAF